MSIDPFSLAITAALTAANMAATAMRRIEGPRLTDTRASLADYGTALNYVKGMRIVSCPCFFSKPIKEVKKKRKGKGGKAVEYSGFGTWACHIADHDIVGISKIWFDNHLVFDATGDEVETYPLADDYDFEANIRFYLGTEDQEPDPDMLAFIEARDGAGTCPAYRGEAYAYFENIPLEMLGNRFPDVKMLIRTSSIRQFEGWYAMASINLVAPTTPLAGFFVEPDGPAPSIDNSDNGFFWDNGVPKCVIAPGGNAAQVYFVDPAVMDATEVKLRLQFPSFSVGDGMMASFSWQFWNQEASSSPPRTSLVISPGSPSGFGDDYALTNPFDVRSLWPDDWYFGIGGSGDPGIGYDAGPETSASIGELLDFVAARCGIDPAWCDFSAATERFTGYNWTQGTGKQILEAVLDLYDIDVRPHDFKLQALPRGGASQGVLPTGEFVLDRGGEGSDSPFSLAEVSPSDLPARVFLAYADTEADQAPNVAMPPAPGPDAAGTNREISLDMQTLALDPDTAQRLTTRRHRRLRFGRNTASFGLTRKRIAIEPGDVWTPEFDGDAMSMRCTRMTIGADGVIALEWERDDPAIAVLPQVPGAAGQGYVPDVVADSVASLGFVLDLPLLLDAHEQSAPLAYIAAGPAAPGIWMGADFAQSETGELDSYTEFWDGIAADDGAVIGTCSGALQGALPWVPDYGSAVTVVINAGELTAATLDMLLADPTRNLAAIRSGDGWELVQFMTPTLTGAHTYSITGFLRGVRGTEWAIGGHAAGDSFILLDGVVKRCTMGAAEIGDTDWYVVSPTGQAPDQAEAFSLAYTGASHKPLAPVHGRATQSGADWLFTATRRTRIGGGSLDNQDVPLGEASESWVLDIMDGPTVVRSIAGTALPLTWTEAQQITDFGSAQGSVTARLHQIDPTLNLRGYPLDIAA